VSDLTLEEIIERIARGHAFYKRVRVMILEAL